MIQKVQYPTILSILLVWSGIGYSQNNGNSFSLWKLNSVSGEVTLNGQYREQQRTGININENQKSSYLSGGLLLKTNSSIIHPNFLVLDIDAAYMPETRRDKFIIIPDQAEVRTFKKLDIGASFFKEKKITLDLYGNFDQSFSSRENLTNVKSTNKHWGGTLGYNSKILPIVLDFHSRKWEEEEVQTGRTYKMDQNIFGARMSKAFTKYDRNEIRYSHDENTNSNQNLFRISNTIDNLEFVSYIGLGSKEKYNLTTMISDFNQHGISNLKRFQASENITIQLPANLSLLGNYNYYNIRQNSYVLDQQGINASLGHQLFKSLQSRINYEYNSIKHTVYQESNTKTGFEFNYSKSLPGGQLLISYKYDRYHQNYISDPVSLTISDEQYSLTDSKIILLRLPDISLASVVVKDITGTIIYVNGLDYILIERNQFIEIRRIPGGSIPDKSIVLIDYLATQAGTYKYDANSHALSSNLYLLNNLLSFYYRFSTQDYSNLEKTDFVMLNYFTQNVAGCRLDLKFINAGAEYENYKSSILPYHMTRYYVNFQKEIGKKVMLMLNGNLQDYVMLNEAETRNQKYLDITGRLIYSFVKQTHLDVDLMYRKQSGRGIDLDLLTSRSEVTSVVNRLYLSVGVELYRRNYVGEKINFKGTYFKIVRKF